MQDSTTGDLLYSACHSNSTPIFPTDGTNVFKLQRRARNGTALAGAGWYDRNKAQTVASVFFQTEDGLVVNGYFECNMVTGRYLTKGEYLISQTAGVNSIHAETGLSVELLGEENGYRVFFHDSEKRVNVLSYTTSTDWLHLGRISQDEVASMALTSVHSGKKNMTVVFPKDKDNLEISRYFKDDTWRLATLPRPLAINTQTNDTDSDQIVLDSSASQNFTLTAWEINSTQLVASVDRSYVRSIFYIGTDTKLHQISNINWQWTPMLDQDARLWPLADAASVALASTNNFDTNEHQQPLEPGKHSAKSQYNQSNYRGTTYNNSVDSLISST
ncbi:hypothetical protein Cob_v012032 [Colletotrichum orbiculare MAFF 240422]|uniref:Fucose-specific lectin n=1 Tax=Colletotrichum orbiculare (strain 104-T / ATCC 96160 / CBS 514.97 / LARS 414 / MAFF 240422) TaxID=1213857 RepID=A0A484F9T7_COLOR|nr:hypothetical protein Cob_v012032 [Colletotrichum orbiculare MAFF 240422]